MMRLLLYLFLCISSLGIAIFSSQNIYLVTVKLISFESIKLPLGLVLVFCTGLGAVLVTFLTTFSKTSPQFTFPSIPKFTKSSIKSPFQNNQKKSQKVTPKNSSTNKKYEVTKDDFDDERNDDWV